MDNQNKNKKKSIDLGSLYPVPKSYEEIQQRHEEVEARRLKRRPKHEPFLTSINITLAMMIFLVGGSNISTLLYGGASPGQVMSTVFLLFLIGLAWVGFTGWQVKRLSNFFDQRNYSPMPFYGAYSISALSLLSAIYELQIASMPIVLVAVILAMINILLINLLAAVVVSKRLQNSYKISGLVAVTILSIAIAIYAAIA